MLKGFHPCDYVCLEVSPASSSLATTLLLCPSLQTTAVLGNALVHSLVLFSSQPSFYKLPFICSLELLYMPFEVGIRLFNVCKINFDIPFTKNLQDPQIIKSVLFSFLFHCQVKYLAHYLYSIVFSKWRQDK